MIQTCLASLKLKILDEIAFLDSRSRKSWNKKAGTEIFQHRVPGNAGTQILEHNFF